ncbi:MAG: 30S ribosomal protein S21 [Bacteroidia bacterium]|nr:30S ribosomal protein S21 [Bacteroidia bacterium]
MLIIRIQDNENIERALKRYKNKVRNTGIHQEVRDRQHFEKPSKVRRNQVQRARYKEKLFQAANE